MPVNVLHRDPYWTKGRNTMRKNCVRILVAFILIAGLASALHATPPDPWKGTAEELGKRFVGYLDAGNYAGATAHFDETMARVMPAEDLGKLWTELESRWGNFRRVRETCLETLDQGADRYRLTYVTCEFKNAAVDLKVVFNDKDQVAGLFTVPEGQCVKRAGGKAPTKESLIETAESFVDLLAKGSYEAATKPFDETMKKEMPAKQLQELWAGVEDQIGGYSGRKGHRIDQVQGFDVIYVTCAFEKMDIDVRVVFDPVGSIAGLQMVPAKDTTGYEAPAYVKPDSFEESEVLVGEGKWQLPGTAAIPKGDGPFPGVVLVHGSGPNDRDETVGGCSPFKDLAWGLASRGVAVLRYDKRTKVHGGKLDSSLTIKEETIDDALVAAALMRKFDRLDPTRVYVLGHSLGGYAAPKIGEADPRLAGLIVLAGSTRALEDMILDQSRYIFSLDGKVDEMEEVWLEDLEKQVAAAKDPALNMKVPSSELPLDIPPAYWLDLRRYDPVGTAKGLAMPMLFLQGGRDYQVTVVDFEGWKGALGGRAGVTFKLYPDLNHLFVAGEGPSSPGEYQKTGHVAEEVVVDIASWISGSSK